ncbi:MAG: hypothetical protein P8X64_06600 [Anaerolineales bacterium]|jgi:hypothetical protein
MVPVQNPLGFYYRPDDLHYSQADLHHWLGVLRNLQIHWLVLRGSLERAVPREFIQGLQLAGVEPFIHVPLDLQSLDLQCIESQLANYAEWNIRYTVFGDRPNQRGMWKPSEWARGGLVDQFIDKFLPVWTAQARFGFRPVFPALEPGGDYWDTAFLQSCLKSLQRRGRSDLFQTMILATYAWTYDRPLDWGIGGPAAWPESKPYHTPQGSQDQRGARIVDWYASIASEITGSALDIFVLAGGVHPDNRRTSDQETQAEIHASLARDVLMSEYSDNLLGFCFYSLSAGADKKYIGWYDSELASSKSAESLERLMLAAPETKSVSSPIKPIAHYLLLPTRTDLDLSANWRGIEPLVMALKPTIGFSPEEARLARQVILIGESDAYPANCEHELREQGCAVRRFEDLESDEILLALPELTAGKPTNTGADHV